MKQKENLKSSTKNSIASSIVAVSALAAAPLPAAASVQNGPYMDFLLGTTMGSTSPALLDGTTVTMTSASSSLGIGFGGRAGLGLAKDDYFTEFNFGVSMMNVANHGQGFGTSLGATVGLVLPTLPIGFNLGFDFADSYSSTDGAFSTGGYTVRGAISFFTNEKLKIVGEVCRHTYTALTAGATSTTPGTGYTTGGIYIGFPIPWKIPKTSWRKPRSARDDIEDSYGRSQTEATPPPAAEPPPPPAAEPVPAPEVAPPPVDPNTSMTETPTDPLAAPPATDPAVPAPDPAAALEGTPPPVDAVSAPPADIAPPIETAPPPIADLPPPPADAAPAPIMDAPAPDLSDLPPPPM